MYIDLCFCILLLLLFAMGLQVQPLVERAPLASNVQKDGQESEQDEYSIHNSIHKLKVADFTEEKDRCRGSRCYRPMLHPVPTGNFAPSPAAGACRAIE
jgi:hypothetical protein